MCVCVSVCVCVCERERECVCVCVCVWCGECGWVEAEAGGGWGGGIVTL